MEIERKWLVNGWPEDLPLLYEQQMRQGYLTTRPTVRIREERMTGGDTQYILCFKSKGTLSRQEVEIPVEQSVFSELEKMIGLPLIAKTRRTYALPDGHKLEVSIVDADSADAFWYAEIEYDTEQAALAWRPSGAGLLAYLQKEVTDTPGQSMGAYWERTRLAGAEVKQHERQVHTETE